jgi:hypothetical protein
METIIYFLVFLYIFINNEIVSGIIDKKIRIIVAKAATISLPLEKYA